MTENGEVETEIDITPVIHEYNVWKDVDGVSTLGQALHPAVINNLSWEEGVQKKVAEFILTKPRQEVLDWVDDRKGLFHLEQSDKYKKVHEIRREIRNILRREKMNNFGG